MHQFRRPSLLASVVFTSVVLSNGALAIEAKHHQMGGTDVTASLTSSIGYGDNVFRGSDNEISSTFLSLQPHVLAVRENTDHKLEFGYEGNGVVFSESSDDNYISSKLFGDYVRRLTSRSEFSIGVGYEDGSTVRGTDITEGTNGDVTGATDFTRKDLTVGYAIGSQKVGPSIELGYVYTDLAFDNFTRINQGRDYALDKVSARLGYQYSVATKFFVDLSYSDYDYDAKALGLSKELDGSEEAIMLGVKWSLNRLISGEISIGSVDKAFDDFQDQGSLTSWNAQVEWTPSARDIVTLESFSRPFEQAGTGLFQDVTQTSVAWQRDLSRQFSVKGAYLKGSVDFDSVARDDDFDTLSMELVYKSGRYSEWSLNYEHEDKKSSLPSFDFKTNTFFLSYMVGI